MTTFPSICRLSEQAREGMPPVRRYAAMVGCPEKYLYLTDRSYTLEDSYVIHKFRDLQVRHVNNKLQGITSADQVKQGTAFVDSLFDPTKSGTITVINGHPSLYETYLLFWHFVCHFAHIKLSNPIKYRDHAFAFIANFRLDEPRYPCPKHQVLSFGPVMDEINNFHVMSYVETLLRFDDLHKIILTSTTDVTSLLERLRIVPHNVNYFFNLSERMEATPSPSMKDKARARTKSIKKIAESL